MSSRFASQTAQLACILTLLAPGELPAQGSHATSHSDVPQYLEDVGLLGVNVLVGGLIAGVVAKFKGKDFARAFWHGSVGGSISFAGRRIAAEGFSGSGIIGRQVAAVGHSAINNAGEGREPFSILFFPVGPLRLQYRSAEDELTARVHLYDLAATIYAASRSELEVDWSASLSQGASVLVAPRHEIIHNGQRVDGMATGAVILLSGLLPPGDKSTLRHETIHVIQNDFMFYAWSDPVEDALIARSGLHSGAIKYVDLGVTGIGVEGFWDLLAPGRSLLTKMKETEAERLEHR